MIHDYSLPTALVLAEQQYLASEVSLVYSSVELINVNHWSWNEIPDALR
jgi:hypothetical protein